MFPKIEKINVHIDSDFYTEAKCNNQNLVQQQKKSFVIESYK